MSHDADNPPADDDLFRWAWGIVAVVMFGLVCMGLVSVYQWYIKATVRPADDVPTDRQQ